MSLRRVPWICAVVLVLMRVDAAGESSFLSPLTDSGSSGGAAACDLVTIPLRSHYPDIRLRPSDTVEQSEVSIAINPASPNQIIVGANATFRTTAPLVTAQSSFHSADGGVNWAGMDGTPTTCFGVDPAVAWTRDGTAIHAFVDSSRDLVHQRMALCESDDGGATWEAPIYAPDRRGIDKDHIEVDLNGESPYAGRTYVAWMDQDSIPYRTVFAMTDDGGDSVSPSRPISTNSAGYMSLGVNIAVQGDSLGTVSAAWVIFDSSWKWSPPELNRAPDAIGFNHSHDGGVSFDSASRILEITGVGPYIKSGTPHEISAISLPSMAVDRSGGANHGRLYVVWMDGRYGSPDILLSSCQNGCGDPQNWAAPVRVNDDTVGVQTDQWHPWITVDPYGAIHIVYYDSRLGNDMAGVSVATSTDGGETFGNSFVSDVVFTVCPIGVVPNRLTPHKRVFILSEEVVDEWDETSVYGRV